MTLAQAERGAAGAERAAGRKASEKSCGSWSADRPLQLAEANATIAVLQRMCSGGRRRSPALPRTVTVTV